MPAASTVSLATVDGVRLNASYWPGPGEVPAYVVCHGFTGSSRAADVVRICAQLVATGSAVLALDLRGHGRSGGLSTAGDAEVHDVAAAVEWMRRQRYGRIVTIGWSMGGSIVLRHAGLGGDTDAVVSVSSPGSWFERGTRPMRIVHWICETRTGRVAVRVGRRTRLSGAGWTTVPESPAEVAGRIAPTPLLVVHGDADHYFPTHHVEQLAAAAPTAEIWVEPGMGHAEAATTAELVGRIIDWVHRIGADVDRRPVVSTSRVCDDDGRE